MLDVPSGVCLVESRATTGAAGSGPRPGNRGVPEWRKERSFLVRVPAAVAGGRKTRAPGASGSVAAPSGAPGRWPRGSRL